MTGQKKAIHESPIPILLIMDYPFPIYREKEEFFELKDEL